MPKVSKEEITWYTVIRGHKLKMDKISHQLQDKGCNQYQHMEDLIKCKPCQEPEAREENCLFKDFRAFHCHETGLRFGYFFPDAIQQRSPLSHSSKRFNQNKPYDPEDRTYLKSKLRDILKETFAQDQPPIHHRAKSQKQALLRKGFEGYRHVCDICLTSIFNYHYFCPACAIDICLHCYSRWRHVKKDPNKNMCHKGLNHSPQMFRLSQKYSKEDISVVREELDDLDDKDIDVIGDEPDAPMDDETNTQKPDPSLLPLTPDSDDQRAGYIEKEECGPIIMIKESGYARSLSLNNNTGDDKDAGSPSLPEDVTDNNNNNDNNDNNDNNNSNNMTSVDDKEDVPINQNKYDHLDGVTMTEPTDRSLPTTIANAATMTTKIFQEIWQDKNPLLVENCLDNSTVSWNPKYFGEKYGNQEIEVIDCKDNSKHVSTAKEFFDSYESEEKLAAYCDKLSTSNVIKIKDWPPKDDFKQVFKDLHDDYMYNVLPAKEYCSEDGYFNVSNRLPEEYMPPDLGPKMFISQGSDSEIKSRTKLHCDMADAVNVMCFSKKNTAAATWEIFASKDLPTLRTFVHKLNKKRQRNFGFDPILSESSYLDEDDLIELEKGTGVKPFRFHQKPGDAVFIPAGCAHQVQNIHGSIKCAYDFLSPETMRESSLVTSHFQDIKLEDKLQLKTTILYSWKSL